MVDEFNNQDTLNSGEASLKYIIEGRKLNLDWVHLWRNTSNKTVKPCFTQSWQTTLAYTVDGGTSFPFTFLLMPARLVSVFVLSPSAAHFPILPPGWQKAPMFLALAGRHEEGCCVFHCLFISNQSQMNELKNVGTGTDADEGNYS